MPYPAAADQPSPAWTQLQARARIAQLQHQLLAQGCNLRAPPPEPTTCCGRGCNGCVWESYYAAAVRWVHDAQHLLQPAPHRAQACSAAHAQDNRTGSACES